jgi:hypothetical protein
VAQRSVEEFLGELSITPSPIVVTVEAADRRPPDVRETIMRYLLLIYSEETTAAPDPAEAEKVMNEYWAYSNAITQAGASTGGEALQDSKTATTVRVKDGERVVTDGPFAETREVLGGFYVIDPGAKYGSVEVRPIMEFDTAS